MQHLVCQVRDSARPSLARLMKVLSSARQADRSANTGSAMASSGSGSHRNPTTDTEGIMPMIQTVKTLEQCITEQYMDGLWSKSTNYLSNDEGSDIVDMSKVPAGHNSQD